MQLKLNKIANSHQTNIKLLPIVDRVQVIETLSTTVYVQLYNYHPQGLTHSLVASSVHKNRGFSFQQSF